MCPAVCHTHSEAVLSECGSPGCPCLQSSILSCRFQEPVASSSTLNFRRSVSQMPLALAPLTREPRIPQLPHPLFPTETLWSSANTLTACLLLLPADFQSSRLPLSLRSAAGTPRWFFFFFLECFSSCSTDVLFNASTIIHIGDLNVQLLTL